MGTLYIESLSDVAAVTRVSRSRDFPRPHVAVIGSVHGNEPCGLLALRRLLDEAARAVLPMATGTLLLIHGNPEASEVGRRYTAGGVDLNRLFDFRFLDDVPAAALRPEHRRALELRTLLESVDALLDLHSTSMPTPPFAIATDVPGSQALAMALGLAYETTGWDAPGLLGDKVLLALPKRRGLASVAVECGQHEDARAPEVAYEVARRALISLGVLEGELVSFPPARRLLIRDVFKRPSAAFKLVEPLTGMQLLDAGALLGADDRVELRVRAPCYAVMPNPAAAVGGDLLFLAVESR